MPNSIRTTLLLGLLTGLLLGFGGWLGGSAGLQIAFLFAVVMNFGSYWFSDRIVLALYRAQPVSESEEPELHSIVQGLATRAGVPKPRVCVIPTDSPNAFATGRSPNHAVVAVTDGIRRILTRDELEGVLAHELAHVKNRDTLISSIAATLAGAILMLANMARWGAIFGGFGGRDERDQGGVLGLVAMSILAPMAALLVQMAVSRSREYGADDTGARITGNPEGLARALEKIAVASARVPLPANAQTAHLFIVNPLAGRSIQKLFSTHPPTEERVRRLRSMRPSLV